MKSNLLRIFFEWALIASVLMSIGFFAWYWTTSRAVNNYKSQIDVANGQFQRSQAIMLQLGKDCDEYAKTNHDFARVLDSLKAQLAGSLAPASASPKPAAK